MLILVENLPVPLDRRVWSEAKALTDAGRPVSVICPRRRDDPRCTRRYEQLDAIRIYRYTPPPEGTRPLGYLREFAVSWLWTTLLTAVVFVRDGFAAIQACNPPDTLFAVALPYKLLGVRFVFDQHDLCPEIFAVRFGRSRHGLARALALLERATYRVADRVISTNESYRSIAIGRGGCRPERVTVVRSGPDPTRFRPGPPRPDLRNGRTYLCCYLGVMGPQDGVDLLLRAAEVVVHQHGRTDVQFGVLGFGECEAALRELADELGIAAHVTFTGRADDGMITDWLSTADVGISPDPVNEFNDVSTMNKTLEYMAMGLPVAAFDLTETRVSAGEAAEYAPANDVATLAKVIVTLLDDPERRAEMGRLGRRRIEDALGWHTQAPVYVGVYDELLDVLAR